jgi:hypothetical protein
MIVGTILIPTTDLQSSALSPSINHRLAVSPRQYLLLPWTAVQQNLVHANHSPTSAQLEPSHPAKTCLDTQG